MIHFELVFIKGVKSMFFLFHFWAWRPIYILMRLLLLHFANFALMSNISWLLFMGVPFSLPTFIKYSIAKKKSPNIY